MSEIEIKKGESKRVVLMHDSAGEKEHIIRLTGPNANVHVDELFLESVKSKLKIIHDAPHTTSRVSTRGVVGKSERSASLVKVVMPKHAQHCDSNVSQKFLLLDKSAKADARPALEIEANEVKAGHAASVCPLDELALFYLEQRGLPREQATRLLVEAFLAAPKEHENQVEQWLQSKY